MAEQKPYYSRQDVSINIETLYNTIVKDIDSLRSRFTGVEGISNLTLASLDSLFIGSTISSYAQESRTNAFFRMMGFPIVSADYSDLYSSGFDPDLNRDDEELKKKLKIANSVINNSNLKSLLNKRENYYKNVVNIFQLRNDDAAALGIASIFPRPFDKQLKEGVEPLDADPQSFKVPDRATVISDFVNPISLSTTSIHILKPFIVDPRVDLTVTPIANRICAPFLKDKSKTQIAAGNYLRRPYIERVLRVRLGNKDVLKTTGDSSADAYINDLLTFIKVNVQVTSADLVDKTGNALKALHKSEIMVYSKFIKIIEALIINLVESITEIGKIRSLINWKPVCNANGPEFGADVNELNPNDTLNNKKIETDIREQQMQKYLAETDFDLGLTTKADIGNFAFSNIDDLVFGSIKNVSNFYDRQITTLTSRREEFGNLANSLMRNIEIITGEFSGLGLLDIMAIQAALWVMKPSSLLGLIDARAAARMVEDNNLQAGSKDTPKEALMELEKKLSEIYLLMQAFYDGVKSGDNKNKQ